jgi:hypothetical protein
MATKRFFNYFALKEARVIHIGKPPPGEPAAHSTRPTNRAGTGRQG